MDFKISAEEKKHPHDECYQANIDYESTHLSDFDKEILTKRIRQANIRWIAKQVITSIIMAYVVYYFFIRLLLSL